MPDRTSDRVFTVLRNEILSGELKLGSYHSIYGFASRFEVSRTPVREAVLRLAELGMVTILRNRGVVISGLSASEVRAIFELRVLLEVPAAGAAARTATPTFLKDLRIALRKMRSAAKRDDVAEFTDADRHLHDLILETLDNPRLLSFVRQLRDATQSMGASTMNQARRLAEIEIEHEPIVDAIARRDVNGAQARMRDHLVQTAVVLLRQVDRAENIVWRSE